MKYFKKLIGEKVYLSPLNVDDAEKFVEWFCDFKTSDGTEKSGNIVTIESEREWREKTVRNNDLHFAIVKLVNDELIGSCGYSIIDYQNRIGTIGILIGDENNRSNGYGTEILRLL